MRKWVIVAGMGIVLSLYGDQQDRDKESSARPEVKNRYHKRGDELLAEIDANMKSARQYSAPRDEHLAESIRIKVLETPSNKYDGVGVVVNRGHVSLWGEVPTKQDKEFIESKVRQIEGLGSLSNNLTVAGSDSAEKGELKDRYQSRGDQEVNNRIRAKISGEPLWDKHLDIELDTYDGVVTVKGNVKGVDQQQRVIDLISQVQGVRGVNNHLQDK